MAAQTSGANSGSSWRTSSPVSQYICKPKGCQAFIRLRRLEICLVLRTIRSAPVCSYSRCMPLASSSSGTNVGKRAKLLSSRLANSPGPGSGPKGASRPVAALEASAPISPRSKTATSTPDLLRL